MPEERKIDPLMQRILNHLRDLNQEIRELGERVAEHDRGDVAKHGELAGTYALLEQRVSNIEEDLQKLTDEAAKTGKEEVARLQNALQRLNEEKSALEKAMTTQATAAINSAVSEALAAEKKRSEKEQMDKKEAEDKRHERNKAWGRIIGAALLGALLTFLGAQLLKAVNGPPSAPETPANSRH